MNNDYEVIPAAIKKSLEADIHKKSNLALIALHVCIVNLILLTVLKLY